MSRLMRGPSRQDGAAPPDAAPSSGDAFSNGGASDVAGVVSPDALPAASADVAGDVGGGTDALTEARGATDAPPDGSAGRGGGGAGGAVGGGMAGKGGPAMMCATGFKHRTGMPASGSGCGTDGQLVTYEQRQGCTVEASRAPCTTGRVCREIDDLPEAQCVTEMSGVIAASTTWGTDRSPYWIAKEVQVAAGATLTIAPGVVVYGESDFFLPTAPIKVWGKLVVAGADNQMVKLHRAHLAFSGNTTDYGSIDLDRVLVDGGSVSYGLSTGALAIRRSVFKGTGLIYFSQARANAFIEGNMFVRSMAVRIWLTTSVANISVKNNVFVDPVSLNADEPPAAVEVSYTPDTRGPVIEKNTFYSTTKTAAVVTTTTRSGYTSANFSVANNYWSTTDEAVIQSMIYDKTDNLDCPGTVTYKPVLTARDPSTPDPTPWLK